MESEVKQKAEGKLSRSELGAFPMKMNQVSVFISATKEEEQPARPNSQA